MTTKPGRIKLAAILASLWVLLAALPLLALVVKSGPLENLGEMASLLAKARTSLLFGLAQAGGSLAVSLLVGLPGAWLVARFRFPGRRLLRALSVVPFCMPPILVALGFVLYYGKNGYLNRLAMFLFHLDRPPIDVLYSFFGLCLVHGFYNYPLVLDMVGSSWAGIPSARSEAARSLGAGRVRAFVAGTLPSLAPAIAESSSLAFLFSFFSFIVVMIFGPLGASTPETEIFRLLRFSGDLPSASVLAIAQSLIALACISVFFAASRAVSTRSSDSRAVEPPSRPGFLAGLAIALYAAFLAVFFLAPLASLVAESFTAGRGFAHSSGFSLATWQRILRGDSLIAAIAASLASAIPASIIATMGGLALGSRLRARPWLFDVASSLPLAVSGVIAATGWHIIFPSGGLGVLILIQALTVLPFSLRSSASALDSLAPEPVLSARALGAGRIRAWVEIEIPVILPMILTSLAFSFSMSIGDATTPLILGIPDFEPLPLLVYRLTSAYRYADACAVGIVLAALSALVFFSKGGFKADA